MRMIGAKFNAVYNGVVVLRIGNASKGVSLGKHADVFLRKCYDDGLQSFWMVIFKVRRIVECTSNRITRRY